jgi:hypothetical protein
MQLWNKLSDASRSQFEAPPPGLPRGEGNSLSPSSALATFGFVILEPDAVRRWILVA